MTEQYIEYKLKTASDAARDLLAWNSIRAESRLRSSPHLKFEREAKNKQWEKEEQQWKEEEQELMKNNNSYRLYIENR